MSFREFLNSPDNPTVYLTPKDFLKDCVRYFEWCIDNPLKEQCAAVSQRSGLIRYELDKVRVFTKQGLATFLGFPVSRLESYKKRKDEAWGEAVEMVEQVIYTQKFEHAAIGLMNATVISRDLGLADKQEVTAGVTVNLVGNDANL